MSQPGLKAARKLWEGWHTSSLVLFILCNCGQEYKRQLRKGIRGRWALVSLKMPLIEGNWSLSETDPFINSALEVLIRRLLCSKVGDNKQTIKPVLQIWSWGKKQGSWKNQVSQQGLIICLSKYLWQSSPLPIWISTALLQTLLTSHLAYWTSNTVQAQKTFPCPPALGSPRILLQCRHDQVTASLTPAPYLQ